MLLLPPKQILASIANLNEDQLFALDISYTYLVQKFNLYANTGVRPVSLFSLYDGLAMRRNLGEIMCNLM